MKDSKHRKEYYAADKIVLRTPAFSIDPLISIPADPRKFFFDLSGQDFFKTAIFVSSSTLYDEMIRWRNGELKDKTEEDKLLLSLLKYWTRMSSRCTPYGALAGCGHLQVDDQSGIYLDDSEHQFRVRIDMDYISELAVYLANLPEVKSHIRYYPNNSLYKTSKDYRYIEFSIKNNLRSYKVSEVSADEYLQKALSKANAGALISDLVDELVDSEITSNDARDFIEELIASKILISELEPRVTGQPFLEVLMTTLKLCPGAEAMLQSLEELNSLLKNRKPSIGDYETIQNKLKSLLPGITGKDILQTDLFLTTRKANIKKNITDEIVDSFEKLIRLTYREGEAIRAFKSKFQERYEEAEIPLMHALDPETGIGFDVKADFPILLNGINPDPKSQGNNTVAWSPFRDFQVSKLHEALLNGDSELLINDEELDSLTNTMQARIPDSMVIIGSLLGSSTQEIDNGNYTFLSAYCGGPSAANLIARFGYADAALTETMQKSLREEESHHSDCIYAEIVHLPQARIGNVLIRPILREYEIPYLCNSAVPLENQILVSDLYVRVHNNEIILHSKRLNKRIIPRMSTAHNYSAPNSLPVYKFLCMLQYQNLSAFNWDWGMLGNSPYLPRVRYRKVIISRAQWYLQKTKLAELTKKNGADLKIVFGNLRERFKIPRFVTLAEGDNELFIDMTNEQCLKILKSALEKNSSIRLKEFLSLPEQCFVENTHRQKFSNEIVIPVSRHKYVESPKLFGEYVPEVSIQRSFSVGSEWFYAKIYCGTKSAEDILKQVVRPLTRHLLEAHVIDKWFFVRYGDPDHHIRIRMHSKTAEAQGILLKKVNEAFADSLTNGVVHKISLDTYQREIERYGQDTIELGERIFYHDSEAVLDFIGLLEHDEDEKFRWVFALRGIDMLLDDFGLSLPQKIVFSKQVSQGHLREYANESNLLKQINDRYRWETKFIFAMMDPDKDLQNEINEGVEIFRTRSQKIGDLCLAIKGCYADYPGAFEKILSSHIHMFINRLFPSNQRKQELVVYNFLYRFYESTAAISKKKVKERVQDDGH